MRNARSGGSRAFHFLRGDVKGHTNCGALHGAGNRAAPALMNVDVGALPARCNSLRRDYAMRWARAGVPNFPWLE